MIGNLPGYYASIRLKYEVEISHIEKYFAGNDTRLRCIYFQRTMEARGAKRVKKMHAGKWQFVIKGGGGVRWTSIGIVMYRAHARKGLRFEGLISR